MPFAKGVSGNPGGRPRLTQTTRQVQDLAREKSVAALNVLVEIAANKETPPAARVSAATAILDRGWGRPAQAIAGATGEGPLTITWLPPTGMKQS